MSVSPTIHVPVMAAEIVHALQPKAGQVIVDGTFGGGGHACQLAKSVMPDGRVVGLDRDDQAVARGESMLSQLAKDDPALAAVIALYCCSYHDAERALAAESIPHADAMLLDLGLSSDQLVDTTRGFGFSLEAPLDLRFDTSQGMTAAEMLQRLSEPEIADLIYQFGEERYSRRIARQLVQRRRQRRPVRTTTELADLVRRCVPRSKNHDIDPATRTFQALRIAVNRELDILQQALQKACDWIRPGGRLVILSFHSLEDRLVKQAFRQSDRWEALTRKPVRPTDQECHDNPRARSAKLRAAIRKTE